MKLLRRRASTDTDHDHATTPITEPSYDIQTDLALPATADTVASDGFVPFAGQLAPDPPSAGYDAQRDTGVEPG